MRFWIRSYLTEVKMTEKPGETLKKNGDIHFKVPTSFEQEIKDRAKEKGYTKTSYSISALEEKMRNDEIKLILEKMTLVFEKSLKLLIKKR